MHQNFSLAEIILVEDNPSDADLTLRALKKMNLHLNVYHFENGAEMLDAVLSHHNSPEKPEKKQLPRLILLDLKLTGMQGTEILKAIKNNNETRIIPVVMLTSSNQKKDVHECYKSGANAYIVKPLDFQEYMNSVSAAAAFWMQINYLPDDLN